LAQCTSLSRAAPGRAARPPESTDNSVKQAGAEEPDQTRNDQVERDDVVEQSWHDKDEDACDERKKRAYRDMKIHEFLMVI
jgi:hypothetical protein